MISIIDSARRFLSWWAAELAASVPRPLKALLMRTPRRLFVRMSEDEVRFERPRNGTVRELGRIDLTGGDEAAVRRNVTQRLRRVRTASAWIGLFLDDSRALSHRVRLPLAALENLREVVGFEMDRHTPFKAEEVYYDFRVVAVDRNLMQLDVEVLLAPRPVVDPLLERLAGWGLRPSFIGTEAPGAGGGPELNILPEERRGGRGPRLVWPTAILALLALVLAAGALYLPLKAQEIERQGLDRRLALVRAQATGATKLRARLTQAIAAERFLIDKKTLAPSVTALMSEITRLLPDNTRLTRATLKREKLTLSGYSESASALIALMERSNELTGVRFSSPVTNDPRLGLERFNISAKVRGRTAAKP